MDKSQLAERTLEAWLTVCLAYLCENNFAYLALCLHQSHVTFHGLSCSCVTNHFDMCVLCNHARSPKAFVSAWTTCGYFGPDHFPAGSRLSREQAIRELDSSGLWRAAGIRASPLDIPPAARWFWAVKVPEAEPAPLPMCVGHKVERAVWSVKRQREKLLHEKPTNWEGKLLALETAQEHIVYNRKTASTMHEPWVRKNVQVQDGHAEVTLKSKAQYEVLQLDFCMQGGGDLHASGKFYLSSDSYPRREVVCLTVNASSGPDGYAMFQQAYAGQGAITWQGASHAHTRIAVWWAWGGMKGWW